MADARESRYSDSSFLYSLMGMTQTQKEAQDAIASVARVVPGSITDVRSFPSSNVKMIAAANNIGNLGFWNVGQSEFHLYCPHLAFISGILIQPHCFSKVPCCVWICKVSYLTFTHYLLVTLRLKLYNYIVLFYGNCFLILVKFAHLDVPEMHSFGLIVIDR